MDRTSQPLVVIAIFLACLAGFVDAIAFTSLGGFFASFMSGNSTRLGVGLGGGGLGEAAIAGALVMSFVSGVILASVTARAYAAHPRESVMVVVTALLIAAAAVGTLQPGPLVLILLAMAMGCENGVFNRDGQGGFGVTYLTGSLVRLGQKAANALMGDKDRWGWEALWAAPVAAAMLTVALRRTRAPATA